MQRLRLLRRHRIYYGYCIVTALFFCNAIVAGCMFYTFGLFVSSLQLDFGWGRGEIMVASTISALVMGGTAPLVGRLVNQYGVSKVMAIGALVGGLGFSLLTQMQDLRQLYTGYTMIGLGSGAAGMLPATTVISNWFELRSGYNVNRDRCRWINHGAAFWPLLYT